MPFTGTAPVMNAILAGQIDYDCDPVLGPLSHVRAGTVKALAIATKKRSPLLPDVPTSYEQGLPAIRLRAVLCAVRAERHAEGDHRQARRSARQRPERAGRAEAAGELGADIAEPNRRGPKALAELVHSEVARLAPILKAAKQGQ